MTPRDGSPPVEVVGWSPAGGLRVLDQRLLPERIEYRDLVTIAEVCDAIATLTVRGAPAIGVAAAMGLAGCAGDLAIDALERDAGVLRAARPTAVNLAWALDRVLDAARHADALVRREAMLRAAMRIRDDDAAMCRAIGEHGVALLRDGMRVLTHCNAGALATAGIGTALAPVYVAHERGLAIEVFACETRPLLQGARLTAWELSRAGIPVTVLTDGMVGSLMATGRVDLVLVGADRIARNGDVANKIGSYGIAVLAKHHRIPFVVAAPLSTVDLAAPDGAAIPIESRGAEEVTHLAGTRVAAAGASAYNPAFDVTPHTLVHRIVTDRGIHVPPYPFAPEPGALPPPA